MSKRNNRLHLNQNNECKGKSDLCEVNEKKSGDFP